MAKSFLLYFLLALPVALAQIMTATTKPPPLSANAVSFASIVPGVAAYTYIGCYQETANDTAANDVRALAGGTMVRNYSLTRLDLANVSLFQNTSKSMTVADCISFCGNSKYAGLESGKECRCAPTLNPQSMKMPDSNCTALCMGDRSEVCGALLLGVEPRKNQGSQ